MTPRSRTEGPWRIVENRYGLWILGGGTGQRLILEGQPPSKSDPMERDDFAFIVLACNSHDSLVAQRDALAKAIGGFLSYHDVRDSMRGRGEAALPEIARWVLDDARSALAALDGGK